MGSATLRRWLIGALALAAVISVVGKKTDSRLVGWLALAVFLGALSLYAAWRRAVVAERRTRISEQEAGAETRTRPDQ